MNIVIKSLQSEREEICIRNHPLYSRKYKFTSKFEDASRYKNSNTEVDEGCKEHKDDSRTLGECYFVRDHSKDTK